MQVTAGASQLNLAMQLMLSRSIIFTTKYELIDVLRYGVREAWMFYKNPLRLPLPSAYVSPLPSAANGSIHVEHTGITDHHYGLIAEDPGEYTIAQIRPNMPFALCQTENADAQIKKRPLASPSISGLTSASCPSGASSPTPSTSLSTSGMVPASYANTTLSLPTSPLGSVPVQSGQSSAQYHYARLHVSLGKFVHFLKLLPSEDFGADVRCELHRWDLDSQNCPLRTAVSYTWGTSSPLEKITILDNNVEKFLPVRANVLSILRHLRQRASSRWLW